MSDVKTMVFPEMGGTGNGLETALLANGGGGMWNNPIWALVFLAFLGRNGIWGGNGENNCQLSQIQSQLNSNQGQTLLMDAIKGNNGAVHELATTLNCNTNAIQTAISGVQSAIGNVGNQVGMTSAQVINAIQSGNMQIANTLQTCCCNIKEMVTTQGYENRINNLQQSQLIQSGFCQVGYEAAQNANGIRQAINDQTIALDNKIDALESARKDREIATLTAQLATANARAERQAELAPILKQLEEIKCKQPNVVTLPYSCATAIPTALAYQYGYYGANPTGGGFL